jgi:ferritin-like metal-binding protein YciE
MKVNDARIENLGGGIDTYARKRPSARVIKHYIGGIPMAKIESLEDLYVAQLKDIYYAEKQLAKALPKMAKKATNKKLSDGFLKHAEETEIHIERLEQVFEMLEISARAEKCEAIIGLTDEAKEIMDDCEKGDVLDAGLIMAGQKAEHYEIATYGSLIVFAETLGLTKQAALLKKTIAEEKATDEKLSTLAEGSINQKAKMAA